MKKQSWPILLAGVLPAACIAFAFSLGPSPHKLALSYQNSETVVERRAQFEAGGPGLWLELERRRTALPRELRSETAQLLWERVPEQLDAASLVVDSELPALLRSEALRSLARSQPRDALELSERYTHLDSVLGETARRTLQRQARSEIL